MLGDLLTPRNNYALYAAIVAQIESGSTPAQPNWEATNPKSSAFGKYQLENEIFRHYIGEIDHSYLAQEYCMNCLTIDNLVYLKRLELPHAVMPQYVYLAHWQGCKFAGRALKDGRWKPAQGAMLEVMKKWNEARDILNL